MGPPTKANSPRGNAGRSEVQPAGKNVRDHLAADSRERKTRTRSDFKPRPAIVVAPVTVTDDDASCFAILGLGGRRLRELGDEHKIPFVRLGKRRVYVIADLVDALRTAATKDNVVPITEAHGDEPQSADDFLAAMGKRRRAGAR